MKAIMILGVATMGAVVSAQTIEDFESFASSADLNLSIVGPTANATVELGAAAGVGGSAGMLLTGNNGASPFFTSVTLDTADMSLDGVDAISVDASFVGGSNEIFRVQLVDEFGGVIADADFGGTQAIPGSGAFGTFSVDTSFTSATFFQTRFLYGGSDFGTTTIAIDNLAIVPAPSAAIVLPFGIALASRRRR